MQFHILFVIFVLICTYGLYLVYKQNKKEFTKSNLTNSKRTIFVSVPSYRDTQCPETIYSLFENAKHPERIRVYVYQQNHKNDKDCIMSFEQKRIHHKRKYTYEIERVKHSEAQGPTHARQNISKRMKNEDFYLGIDSHMRFVHHWDEIILNEWDKCKSNHAILTTTPRAYDPNNQSDAINEHEIPHNSQIWYEDGFPRAKAEFIKKQHQPMLTKIISEGFLFMPSQAIKDVPLDPFTPFLFSGEEFYHSARLWTHGYDFYTPQQDIVFHYYDRENEPKFWNDQPQWSKVKERSIQRVRKQFNLPYDIHNIYNDALDQYSFGSKRSVDEYLEMLDAALT